MTLDTHWEFRTISTLYTLDYSRMPMEVYHAAMLTVVKAGFFYENNSHTRILRMLRTGLEFSAPMLQAYMNSSHPARIIGAGAAKVAQYGATKAYAAYKAHNNKNTSMRGQHQKQKKPTNRKIGVAGRTEKVERPETDGEDRQIWRERRRLRDRKRAKKIDRLETDGKGRKAGDGQNANIPEGRPARR